MLTKEREPTLVQLKHAFGIEEILYLRGLMYSWELDFSPLLKHQVWHWAQWKPGGTKLGASDTKLKTSKCRSPCFLCNREYHLCGDPQPLIGIQDL